MTYLPKLPLAVKRKALQTRLFLTGSNRNQDEHQTDEKSGMMWQFVTGSVFPEFKESHLILLSFLVLQSDIIEDNKNAAACHVLP